MNRNYESMIILKPELGDQEREEIVEKVVKKIESLEGKILISKLWAKEKAFHYFLRGRDAEKKKYYKGAYWLFNFILDISKLSELKEVMRLEERILRSAIINRESKMKSELIEKPFLVK